jgi:hypothetical protein
MPTLNDLISRISGIPDLPIVNTATSMITRKAKSGRISTLPSMGVLSHLWKDPSKAEHLSDPDTRAFANAFVAEPDRKQAGALKSKGIQKRFSASGMPNAMSDLYRLLSAYSVHGGSPKQLVNTQINPTRVSFMFLNRPDPLEETLTRDVEVLANGCEVICIELSTLLGTFGKRYGRLPSKAGEGGFYLTKLFHLLHQNHAFASLCVVP